MCGRFRLALPDDALSRLFAVEAPTGLGPRYNIAPGQTVLAVRRSGSGQMESWTALWGLVPGWSRGPHQAQLINARSETAAVKPAFRGPFRRRRCLIPADGFYEWSGRKGAGARTPWLIRMRHGSSFAFAGLWDRWSDEKTGETLETVAILTTAPNSLMLPIHDRMPVILDPGSFDLWTDATVDDPERVQPLLRPSPPDAMEAVRIGTFVNNPRNEGPECSAPLRDGLF